MPQAKVFNNIIKLLPDGTPRNKSVNKAISIYSKDSNFQEAIKKFDQINLKAFEQASDEDASDKRPSDKRPTDNRTGIDIDVPAAFRANFPKATNAGLATVAILCLYGGDNMKEARLPLKKDVRSQLQNPLRNELFQYIDKARESCPQELRTEAESGIDLNRPEPLGGPIASAPMSASLAAGLQTPQVIDPDRQALHVFVTSERLRDDVVPYPRIGQMVCLPQDILKIVENAPAHISDEYLLKSKQHVAKVTYEPNSNAHILKEKLSKTYTKTLDEESIDRDRTELQKFIVSGKKNHKQRAKDLKSTFPVVDSLSKYPKKVSSIKILDMRDHIVSEAFDTSNDAAKTLKTYFENTHATRTDFLGRRSDLGRLNESGGQEIDPGGKLGFTRSTSQRQDEPLPFSMQTEKAVHSSSSLQPSGNMEKVRQETTGSAVDSDVTVEGILNYAGLVASGNASIKETERLNTILANRDHNVREIVEAAKESAVLNSKYLLGDVLDRADKEMTTRRESGASSMGIGGDKIGMPSSPSKPVASPQLRHEPGSSVPPKTARAAQDVLQAQMSNTGGTGDRKRLPDERDPAWGRGKEARLR